MTSLFGPPRIKTKQLAELSRRLSIGLAAGVDVRKSLAREAKSNRGPLQAATAQMSAEVDRGTSVSDAINARGEFFPPLYREMVRVGEQSGQLAEVFRQLSQHYDHQLQLRRAIVAALTWPLVQLAAAIGVVGFLIWIVGAISPSASQPIDLLGFGLTGNRGLLIYLLLVGSVIAGLALVYRAVKRGVIPVRPMQRLLLRIPKIGEALATLALARLAWSLHVTLNTGMDIKRALSLSLASTQSPLYTDHIDEVVKSVAAGDEIHEAFALVGGYPRDFLDAVEVGEHSGRLVESMQALSIRYQEEAHSALNVLAVVIGFVVWGFVALIIILLIFRIFSFYLGVLSEASKM